MASASAPGPEVRPVSVLGVSTLNAHNTLLLYHNICLTIPVVIVTEPLSP